MIFKTIDDNVSLSGQRIVSKFTARKIAQEEATKQLEIDIQCLRNYEAECQKGSVSTETFSNTMKGASVEAQKYAVNIKEGTGSAQTFATNQRTIQASMSETSIVSKVAATGLSIFKAALNSIIFFAVIEGIQLLIKGIDNLILTADEAEEKAEALRGNMQSFFDEVQSGQQTISSVSDRFSELSEHVTKTGENIDLTKDEYSEYLDICNQVKSIMPELVTGYTNEGNVIITLKDNVDSLTESYKENIRAKAAAFITNGDDDGNTIQSFFDDYKIFTEGENGLFAPSASGLWNNKSTDYEDYYGYDKVHEWLQDVADLSLKDLQNLQKGTTQATYLYALLKENGYELANITEDNYEAVHDVLDTRLTSLEGEMATRVSNVKMSLQQMLYADRDYWDIDDKEALSAIDLMFSSIDSEFIKQNNLLGQDALQSFESNVIKLFEDKDTQKAMIDIYTPQGDDESIEDYSKRVNDAIEKVKKYIKDNNLNVSLDFGTDENPKGIKESVDKLEKSYDQAIDRFSNHATEKQNKAMAEAQQNLTDEYGKIHDWGLDDYADQIKNGTIQSKFGNVDMDKRTIIHWSDELKQTYADALASWDYDPEVGSIDTVFGGSQRFGEDLNGNGWEVAFTPILPDGTFLSKDTVEEYINSILAEAYADDGKVTEDELTAIDAQGRQVGNTFVQGIFAGIDDSQNYDDNGNWAEVVGRLMHFSGKDGAVQIAKDEIAELEKQFGKDGSQKIKDFFDTEGINTQEEIDAFNDVTNGITDADEAIQKWNEHKKESSEDTFELPDTDTLKQQISDLNSAIDSIQSAYDTLNSAVEEYNTNGGTLSIDTIQSLLSLSDEYLACLQVENGQLSLNADAMAQLAQAKLDDAQATAVTQAMTELQAIANGEAAQSTTNYIAGNAALMSSLAQLSGSYEGVAKAAMTAAQAQKLSALISNAAEKDKTATENVMKGLDTKLKLIQTTKASINAGNFGKVAGKSSSSSKGSGKSASDTAKEEIEAYMKYMEASLDAGKITYQQYVDQVSKMLDDMYHQGKISAKEYFDYVKERLSQQLDIYKAALSAVTSLLDDTMDKIQDDIDSLNDKNDALNQQKDDYDSILSVVDDVYQKEIDKLNEQKDLLQDKIDALNDQNDALDLQYRKEQALYALRKAQEQRTKKIFNGKEFIYDTDKETIRDAQKNLQDIENEEIIKKLEDEQDALDKSIEDLEKYRDLWAEIADTYKKNTNEMLAIQLWGKDYENLILQNRIQDINGFKDNYLRIQSQITDNEKEIKSLEEKKEIYQQLKDQWNSISSEYENQMNRQYAVQLLGANWEQDVLNGRLDVLNNFRNQYIAIQQAIADAAWQSAQAQIQAAQAAQSGGSGGGGGGSTSIQNQQAYHVLHLVGGYSTSGEASSKISSFNGKGVYKYKDGKWYVYKEEDYSNLSFGSESEADDYIKKHLSPAGRFLVKYYHNGLENGLVDFNKKDSNFDLVQKYGLKKYEVPAILKQGEAVMNQEQIKNLGEALRAIPTAATLYTTPDYTKMLSSLKTNNTPVMVTQSVDITLPNVTNNSGYENLTRELNRLKLDAYQFVNKR